jgi:hypothetical protein
LRYFELFGYFSSKSYKMTFKKQSWSKPFLLAFVAACSFKTNAQQGPTLITKQQLYYYYFNATQKNNFTGKEYKLDLDKETTSIEAYINATKDFSRYLSGDNRSNFGTGTGLAQLDQFDRKRMIDSAKREIRREMRSLDYNREYACILPLERIGEYFFEKKQLQTFLSSNMEVGGDWGSFFLTFLNGLPINKMYFPMDAEQAEAIVKGLDGKEASKYISYIVYFKILPYCYETKNRYLSNVLAAKITRITLHNRYFDEETHSWKLSAKIAEKKISQNNFPNPMIGTQ